MPETIAGSLSITSATTNKVGVRLTGGGEISAGGSDADGTLLLKNKANQLVALLGVTPRLFGGKDETTDAMLLVNKPDGKAGLRFMSINSELIIGEILRFLDGTLRLGSGGKDGRLVLRDAGGNEAASFGGAAGEYKIGNSFHYQGGLLRVGCDGKDGIFYVMNAANSVVIALDSRNGEVKVKDSFRYQDGALRLGSGGVHGKLILRNAAGAETVRVDGEAGDVVLSNADCAEDFDLSAGEEAVPGAVMVLGEDGSLLQSAREYDTAVAGVVSGAGSYRPGIVLDRHESDRPRVPLAMIGKVFCLVDADFGAVRPGSLLTTSPRRGHAMRADDPARAFGAVLGKALKPLERGQALVPVMVALQ